MTTQDQINEDSGQSQKPSSPVSCLGMTFQNDEVRRAHFTEELREKLHDPEFRKIEGFPIGSDEDILSLSDPPYYTACPNPWVADFITEWEAQKPEQSEGYHYHREPFASDVSEGKNDPIYNAHSYHTKVPYKAIMRYILHYTQPGDIVFDGFCGTGMTGVAVQMCGDREVVMSLGYQVNPDGTILQEETDDDGKKVWRAFSKLGVRKAVLNDLSPAATFIAYNYNIPVDVVEFKKEVKRILNEIEGECGWMYETNHTNGHTGIINHILWSDVFICPECATELVFWDVAVEYSKGVIRNTFSCTNCSATLNKKILERAWITKYDAIRSTTLRLAKQVPVLINYSVGTKRFEKMLDQQDFLKLEQIELKDIPHWYPTDPLPAGYNTAQPIKSHGIKHIDLFFTKSGLWELAAIWEKADRYDRIAKCIQFSHTAASSYVSKLRRFRADKKGGGPLAGTLYIASLITPPNPVLTVGRNANFISKAFMGMAQKSGSVLISCQSKDDLIGINSNSLDYIFIDPPFGSNLNYSELNFLWETWLKVKTNNKQEAIENAVQKKGGYEYRTIMSACFSEAYRVLKPGRWMTVEFSNTKASVWNNIQTALTEAGFIVANVSALDKKQGSFKAVTTPTAVKQDLVISAYKPNGGLEKRFLKEAKTEEGVWDFVRTHLKYLPITKQQGALLQFVPERGPRMLFDRMVAYYVRTGYPIPISSQEFQIGLSHRFIERDGMYFLPDQVAEYDRKKMTSGELKQMTLFVSDEASAIQWLRHLIKEKPQTFSDINPQFMQQLGGWNKNEAQLDLRELLNQNFLCYDGQGLVPEQIHAYLSSNWKELRNLPKDDLALVAKACDRWYVPDPNKAGDLEKLREKALLREFEEYKESKNQLKVFRLEAVRTGFMKAWQDRNYAIILAVADKVPIKILEEDPKLLMWYDQAVTRMGSE